MRTDLEVLSSFDLIITETERESESDRVVTSRISSVIQRHRVSHRVRHRVSYRVRHRVRHRVSHRVSHRAAPLVLLVGS